MERFAEVLNDWKPLIIFANHFILDVWQGSEYAFGTFQNSRSKTWSRHFSTIDTANYPEYFIILPFPNYKANVSDI